MGCFFKWAQLYGRETKAVQRVICIALPSMHSVFWASSSLVNGTHPARREAHTGGLAAVRRREAS